jgi:predicted ArsR family transcriptional regulator
MSHISAIEFSKAMSSPTRVDMLRLLATKDMSAGEIASKLSLKTMTVRHHLSILYRIGMVEQLGEERRKVGRPVVKYRVTRKPMSIQFPRRHYEILSEILLKSLIGTLGRERTKVTLRQMGRDFGANLARELTEKHGVEKWNMKALRKYLVEQHLYETGAVPEIVDATDHSIRFRMHNCLLSELAKEYPDFACDGFDCYMFEAAVKGTIGKADVEQAKCVAHGDPYCEYVIRAARAHNRTDPTHPRRRSRSPTEFA